MDASIPQADPALIARARSGDAEAHARLYQLFAPMVYTVARRMLAATAPAEDVLQETFVEVIRKMKTYRGEADFGFWVRRIAINKCLMHLRSSWVSRRVDEEAPEVLAAAPRIHATHDERMALEQALAELPDTARAVVWLHDVEGYTHKEIGRMMGRTTSFSKSQLARAHDRLRMALEGEQGSASKLCTPELKTC